MVDADVDRVTVGGDPAAQGDEGGDATAPCPGQPPVQGVLGGAPATDQPARSTPEAATATAPAETSDKPGKAATGEESHPERRAGSGPAKLTRLTAELEPSAGRSPSRPDRATGSRPGLLSEKVDARADVRFLLGDPGSVVTSKRERVEATPLSVSTRIEMTRSELAKAQHPPAIRFGDRHIAMSVWIFDDDAVVATHIGSGLGQESVTLHLRRRSEGGVFDRYADHFKDLWAGGSTDATS